MSTSPSMTAYSGPFEPVPSRSRRGKWLCSSAEIGRAHPRAVVEAAAVVVAVVDAPSVAEEDEVEERRPLPPHAAVVVVEAEAEEALRRAVERLSVLVVVVVAATAATIQIHHPIEPALLPLGPPETRPKAKTFPLEEGLVGIHAPPRGSRWRYTT